MVARVPSFTAGLGTLYDSRGWTYVYLYDALEMLIIRFVKGLNVLMLPYIESCGAWMLEYSKARMKIRTITAASRSYQRARVADTDNQGDVPGRSVLRGYGKNASHSSTVRKMVELMRQKSFLTLEHRQGTKLRNVLATKMRDHEDERLQMMVSDIENYGRTSAELHGLCLKRYLGCSRLSPKTN